MGKHRATHHLLGHCLALLLALPAGAQAGFVKQSALSRWLANEATPAIRETLSQHPRFQGRAVELTRLQDNGLTDALVKVLAMNLHGRQGITVYSGAPKPVERGILQEWIDDLDCGASTARSSQLQVSASKAGDGQAQVLFSLADDSDARQPADQWLWRGSLSQAERKVLAERVEPVIRDGSLRSPWLDTDIEPAAWDLQRQMACSLRPQVKTRLTLEWVTTEPLPPLFADTANRSRHLLGSYRELGFSQNEPDFVLTAELTPFQGDIWQLWLKGVPRNTDLAPVQAVTYFRSTDIARLPEKLPLTLPTIAQTPPDPKRGEAAEHLAVALIDTAQAESGGGKAALLVRVRLENPTSLPIYYAFRLSGGHYQHCIPRPAFYRHDGYGLLTGRLQPGESQVRALEIRGAQHRPNPWFGPRKCAGFRNLEGLEDFADKGDIVTEYVRWGR
jgi:hypothetical protein